MGDKKLTILHFNDVYNIESQKMEPAGGAARMSHYVKSLHDVQPLVLFSGDALNPSLMSIFLKGEQMIPVLNDIGVHCAVYGNHDFDFGVDHLEDFIEKTKFPWLMSNITDKLNSMPLANGQIKKMIDWHGVKVGLMGLVEEEWIDTLSTIDPADIIFEDFVEVGNKLATELREEGADYVIALTHMRWPNDRRLAREVAGIDMVLGGHDHDYTVEQVNGKYVIKSGTDFRNMSKITLQKSGGGLEVDVQQVDFTSDIPEDKNLLAEVKRLAADIDSKMDEHLGSMGVSMDGRFSSIRTMETNLGNFVTDIILEAVPADICMMNSGTFRSDRIHSKGEFKLRDLLTILPLVDPLIVIEITGANIVKALENGVSAFPKLEGRFPQMSGLKFVFDPSKPPGSRIEPSLVQVQDQDVIMDQKYRLCTKEYIASGKDGYDMFKECPIVVESEQCPSISTAVRNHFESVQIMLNEKPCRSGHRQSLCSIVRRTMLLKDTVKRFMSMGGKNASVSRSTSTSSVELTFDQTEEDETDTTDRPDGRDKNRNTAKTRKASGDHNHVQGSPRKRQKHQSGKIDSPDGMDLLSSASVTQVIHSSVTVTSWSMLESTKFSCRRDSLIGDSVHLEHLAKITQAFMKPLKTAPKKVNRRTSNAFMRQASIEDVEQEQTHLCPKVEGRIVRADQKTIASMMANKLKKKSDHNVSSDSIWEKSGLETNQSGTSVPQAAK